jgi:methylated-DNA-[protein]-cysteine S-methyltransferase
VTGSSLALFDTAIGCCAIVWRGDSIVGTALPETSDARLRSSILDRFPGSSEAPPPPPVKAAVEAMTRLLDGEDEDLTLIDLDLSGSAPFERAVYAAARAIPRGEVRTYGEIAEAIGTPGAARAVGGALGRNPFPIIVPCHRVLASAGKSGGFSAPGGAETKLRMLEIEGARRERGPELFERLPWAVKA